MLGYLWWVATVERQIRLAAFSRRYATRPVPVAAAPMPPATEVPLPGAPIVGPEDWQIAYI